MKRKLNASRYIYRQFKHFYLNQNGVYAVMTALLAFPLLFLIAFTVDGTGMLLDKARFAQATDQAALLLVAENNAYRKGEDHNDLKRQSVSKDELDAYKREFSSDEKPTRGVQMKKRNQELVQRMVKLYLRSDDSNGQRNSTPITIPKDFIAECRSETKTRTNGEASKVACKVEGDVERKFFLPWSHTLTSTNQDTTTIGSGVSYAVKEKDIAVPIDLMLVNDFSGSMTDNLQGHNRKKIDILKDVVGHIADELIKKDLPENISKYNRIGFVSFALGAQQFGNDYSRCVLPFDGNADARIKVKVAHWVHPSDGRPPYEGTAYRILRNQFNLKNSDYNMPFNPEHNDGYMYIEDNAVKLSSAFLADWVDNTIAYSEYEPEHPIETVFYKYFDMKKTLNRIDKFDGSSQKYDITFNKAQPCLKARQAGSIQNTTNIWFTKGESEKLKMEMSSLKPEGWTLASSGVLIGANLLMDKNKNPETDPTKLRTNTQRILIILSDGEDRGLHRLTRELIEEGMCSRIKSRLDTLQDQGYRNLPAKIAFVAFGYKQTDKIKSSWKNCVGNDNYYQADDPDTLLKVFKQIIGLEEEVGRSSTFAPDLFK